MMDKREKPGETIWIFKDQVACQGDIYDFRDLKLTIRQHKNKGGALKDVPHFGIMQGGGMAFPEVLRGYARLLTNAADYLEGVEPIDFQI